MDSKPKHLRKPEWLRIKLPSATEYANMRKNLGPGGLHTICESGLCPNMGECWKSGTATFMILGDICTRNCKFCNVKTGKPLPIDPEEPNNIANAVESMELKHCVLTSVDRDDLEDGGASAWAETIKAIKNKCPYTTMETLIPDFQGNKEQIDMIAKVAPDVVSHNLETVRRLTPIIRGKDIYDRSLSVLEYLASKGIITKSGIMLGLGETEEEIIETMDDLRKVNCKVMTIGQYLQPSAKNYQVQEYVHPDTFKKYEEIGLSKGFMYVESGPLVRSSYHAEKHLYM